MPRNHQVTIARMERILDRLETEFLYLFNDLHREAIDASPFLIPALANLRAIRTQLNRVVDLESEPNFAETTRAAKHRERVG